MAVHGVRVCRDGWKELALVTAGEFVSKFDELINGPASSPSI